MLAVEKNARTVLVTDKDGKRATFYFEDLRSALTKEYFVQVVQMDINSIEVSVEAVAEQLK